MFSRILLVVETSRESLEAANVAVELAGRLGSELMAFSVLDTGVVRQIRDTAKASEMLVDLEENAWKYLYHVEEIAVRKQVHIVLQLAEGIPQKEIVNAVQKFKIDLLIIPRKGERGVLSGGIGKLIEQLVERASCAVMMT